MADELAKKISELDTLPNNDLDGFFTIGSKDNAQGNPVSYKVNLGFVKEAAQDAEQAAQAFDAAIVQTTGSNTAKVMSQKAVTDALATKQGTISDLEAIREGAADGATAYQLPDGGIPKSHLSPGVQSSLGAADTAVQPADIADFITRSVNDLANYYLKAETYTKTEVDGIIGAINQFHYEVYASISAITSPASNVLYLIGPTGSGTDKYEEYVYANSTFVKIGDTSVDLSGYVTTTALNTALANYTTTANLTTLLNGKVDKDTDAVPGNVAKFDASGNPVDSGLSADNIAQKDGSYDSMAVGIAKNLEGRTNVTDSFFERTTGGDAEVANGLAQMMEVEGKSQVWNQLSEPLNTHTVNGVTLTKNADGTITVDGTTTASGNLASHGSISVILGHKYFIKVNDDAFDAGLSLYSNIQISTAYRSAIVTASATGSRSVSLRSDANKTYDNVVAKVYCIDLTLLGIDSLTTVAQVEAWLAENIGIAPYYPYNAGTVLNNCMTGIESYGFNLLDPATGKARIVGAYSDVYGNYYGITGTHGTLTFTSDLGEVSTITPDSDGKFLLETPGWLDVATPGNDCAVFLWWDGTKTEYEEYDKQTAYLDVEHIYGKLNGTGELVQVWLTGMPGIGDKKDALKVVDGQVVAERKFFVIPDLSELDFTEPHATITGLYYASLAEYPTYSGRTISTAALIARKYQQTNNIQSGTAMSSAQDNTYCFYYNNTESTLELTKYIYIKDTSAASLSAFKSALSGASLVVELLHPETYTDLVYQGSSYFADGTPVTLPVNYAVNNWGIERVIPQNSSEAVVTSAPVLSCKYSIDAVEELDTQKTTNEYNFEQVEAKKADKTGDYPLMSVGTARNLAEDNVIHSEVIFEKTPTGAATGLASVQKAEGKSLVWNQMVQTFWFSTQSRQGITLTNNNDGTYTIDGEADSNITITYPSTRRTWGNHKYYVLATDENIGIYLNGAVANAGNVTLNKQIVTADNTEVYSLGLRIPSGTSFTNKKFTLQAIDLTLLFGPGNEPSTVAEFEAMYPLPYYAYNAGTIINNNTTAIEAVGFNQWDEEWESGQINATTGEPEANANRIRTKNFIQILSGSSYYLKSVYLLDVFFYDAGKNYISKSEGARNQALSLPSNTRFIKFFAWGSSAITTYNHDICINLSDQAKNGTYEPYEKHTLTLGLNSFDVKDGEGNITTVEGLKSAGSVHDEIDLVRQKYIKRVGTRVFSGTDTWTYNDATHLFAIDKPSDIKVPASLNNSRNGVCSKFIVTDASFAGGDKPSYDKCISWGSQSIVAKDSAYSNASTFATAMSGVMLNYELATPVEYDLVNPIGQNIIVNANGTLRRLPEDTASVVLPPLPLDFKAAMDAVGILNGLPQNTITKESMQAFLTTLGTAMNGTWSMSWDSTNGRYQFSFVSNS